MEGLEKKVHYIKKSTARSIVIKLIIVCDHVNFIAVFSELSLYLKMSVNGFLAICKPFFLDKKLAVN